MILQYITCSFSSFAIWNFEFERTSLQRDIGEDQEIGWRRHCQSAPAGYPRADEYSDLLPGHPCYKIHSFRKANGRSDNEIPWASESRKGLLCEVCPFGSLAQQGAESPSSHAGNAAHTGSCGHCAFGCPGAVDGPDCHGWFHGHAAPVHEGPLLLAEPARACDRELVASRRHWHRRDGQGGWSVAASSWCKNPIGCNWSSEQNGKSRQEHCSFSAISIRAMAGTGLGRPTKKRWSHCNLTSMIERVLQAPALQETIPCSHVGMLIQDRHVSTNQVLFKYAVF